MLLQLTSSLIRFSLSFCRKYTISFTMKSSHVQIIPESQKLRQFLTVGKRGYS